MEDDHRLSFSMSRIDVTEDRTAVPTPAESRLSLEEVIKLDKPGAQDVDIEAAKVEKTEHDSYNAGEDRNAPQVLKQTDFPEGGLQAWATVAGA